MTSSKTIKEVQKLTIRIAALNRFVSKATDKCLPFFKTLKQAFVWTDECEIAFQELKHYLSNPPFLNPSKEEENLYLCCERNFGLGKRQEITPSLQSQPSFPRGRSQVPKD